MSRLAARIRQCLAEESECAKMFSSATPLLKEAASRIDYLENAYAVENDNICQVLGKALGYPWFKDDQKNFPGATQNDGVCVGDHIAESIAHEAAQRIVNLEKRLRDLEQKKVSQ